MERCRVCEFTLCRASELVLCLDNGTAPVDAVRSNDFLFFIADLSGAEGFPAGAGAGAGAGVEDALRFKSFLRGAGVGNC